ncbi:sodium:solute symporter family protein [Sinomicrobium soli]|uniref:sodium:solute symporter n=1 Tax=Sinomicrobium sp. N-1-3-6 TaxID=2219864 RepID=UPI000DCB6B35|nr:sodium:solute symporter [Sinomicrobium sp. N-1-3-6]RAV30346.1 sodium:solute symporter [Sinomicrobium sp. N-1-3-6]
MKLPVADLSVFFIYMLAIILFGISFSFRKRSSDDYVKGGGKIPSWAIGMSVFATFVSSISFLALPGKAYLSDWNGFVFSLSIPLAAILAVVFFVPLYRSLQSNSAYYYLEQRFGLWARIYASAFYLLTQIARMGAILYLLALPMNALLGWDISTIIILTGVSVTIYAMFGGIEAVIWTDAIQGIILIGGAIATVLVICFSIPGGAGEIFRIAEEQHKMSLGSFDFNFVESTFWLIFVYGLFINLQNFGIDQSYIQRYITARNNKEAVRSTLFGSLLYIPVSLLFFFIGTALFAYYQSMPGLLPEDLRGLENADKIYPYFIVNELPRGITGLLIASIFAAGMSTISTSINSSATVILTDHYKRYIKKNLSAGGEMKVLLVSSLIMGSTGIGAALLLNGVTSALDAWWALSSIFSGGILGLFLLGFISRKVTGKFAFVSVVTGILVICWMSLSPFFPAAWEGMKSTFHANLTIVLGTVTILFTGFVLTLLFSGRQVPVSK